MTFLKLSKNVEIFLYKETEKKMHQYYILYITSMYNSTIIPNADMEIHKSITYTVVSA